MTLRARRQRTRVLDGASCAPAVVPPRAGRRVFGAANDEKPEGGGRQRDGGEVPRVDAAARPGRDRRRVVVDRVVVGFAHPGTTV